MSHLLSTNSLLDDWAKEWQLSFNSSKCKVMHIGSRNPQRKYHMIQKDTTVELETSEKDIGVNVDSNLKFDRHVEIQCGKSQQNPGNDTEIVHIHRQRQHEATVYSPHPPDT